MQWIDSRWDMADIPLLMARSDHIAFLESINARLHGGSGQLDNSALLDHRDCRLGQWYYHQGRLAYGELPAFIELEKEHREFHRMAHAAVDAFESGNQRAADQFEAGMRQLHGEILAHLSQIEAHARKAPGVLSQNGLNDPDNGPSAIHGRGCTLLLINHSPRDIEHISGMLGGDFTLRFATSAIQALEQLGRFAVPDLILLDDRLPDIDPFELCRSLREDTRTATVPVLFVTDRGNLQAQSQAFRFGAIDILGRPLERAVMRGRIQTHLDLRLRTEMLEQRASLDGLTGLANRRQLDETLDLECRRAQRQNRALSLLLIDVDYFKAFNDQYGHPAGDDCLRRIAVQISGLLQRPGDFAARYGGEEFAVVLPDTDAAGARSCAERLLTQVRSLAIRHIGSPVARQVSISAGCASCAPPLDYTPQTLLAAADRLLYQAKAAGRDRVICSGMDESSPVDNGSTP